MRFFKGRVPAILNFRILSSLVNFTRVVLMVFDPLESLSLEFDGVT